MRPDSRAVPLPEEAAPSPSPRTHQPSPWLPVLNVSMSWTSQLVSIAGSFVVTPALMWTLGDARYGAWLLMNSFVSQLRTLDLGMSAGTLKHTAGALARGDRDRLRRIHSSSAAMFVMASGLGLVATGALAFLLPRVFPEALGGQQPVIVVLGIAATLDLVFHPQPASLRARSFYFVPDFVEVATYAVFKLGLVLYLSRHGLSLWLLCLLILAESVVRNLANTVAGFWLCDWTRAPSPRLVDASTVKELALYGGGMFLVNIGEMVRFQLDSAVIGFFLTAELIAVYSIGMRLIHLAYQALGVIGAVFVPRFSGLHEQGDRPGYERLLIQANLVTDLAAGYVLANIAILGLPFLQMWIRRPWVGDAFLVTLIMLPSYFVGLLAGPGTSLLIGAGKLRGLTVLTMVEAGVNLASSVLLVRWLGIYGVCLGTAIPMLLFRGVVFPFVLREHVGIPIRTYYRSHVRGGALALLYGVLILPVLLLDVRGPVAFVAAGLGTSAVFVLLTMAAVPEARARLLRRWRQA